MGAGLWQARDRLDPRLSPPRQVTRPRAIGAASARDLRRGRLLVVVGALLVSCAGAATGFVLRGARLPAAAFAAEATPATAPPAAPVLVAATAAVEAARLEEPVVADTPLLQPQCPRLTAVDPPWLVVGPAPPRAAALPETPRSLERRVAFWSKVWGERGDNQHFLVDARRPWIVHAEVDCRDLFTDGPPEAAKNECGARLTAARRAAQARLKRSRGAPALLKLYDGNSQLAKTADDHVMGIQGRRDALARAKERAAPSLGLAEGLFAVADVPRIYARAAIVESLWRPEALSRTGAAGAYQFMPKTGRQFLAVEDGLVDERLDPLRSSWAAAKYMSKMSRELGAWPLVLTAYNTGPARLKKVMKARGTRDLGKIADAGTWGEFGFDGQNYYAQIVAIGRLTANDRFEPKPITGRAMRLDEPLAFADLAACVDAPIEVLAEANPALADAVIHGEKAVPAGYVVHVPSPAITTAQR
jgi:membrane-bound lytic murein transglycosylase D